MANHGCLTNPCRVCSPDRMEYLADRIVAFVESDDCTCEPGTNDNGWHEKRCEPCVKAERAERAEWAAMFVRHQRYGPQL